MNSCRWSAVTITALLLALPLFTAFAAERLDWGAQLHSGPQACPNGRVIVNAVQKVVNSVDSGTTRAVWAFEIGRASCRERVEISVVAGSSTTKKVEKYDERTAG